MNIIETALDELIESENTERELDGKWHPSSMYSCDRAAVLAVRMTPREVQPTSRELRIFKIGHLYHELVQRALSLTPDINIAYNEFEVDVPALNLRGAGDSLIFLRNGDGWVVEIKSTNSLKYTPKAEHEQQSQSYAVAVRDFGVLAADGGEAIPPLGDRLKGVIIVYLEKSTLQMVEYTYPYDPAWRTRLEEKIAGLERFRDIDELPMALPRGSNGKPNWFTNYCPYRGSGVCCGDKQPKVVVEEEEDELSW